MNAFAEKLGRVGAWCGQNKYLSAIKNAFQNFMPATIAGDYGMALQAFILNPQIPSGEKAKQVLDELLLAHKKYLPQFAAKIAELEAAGVTIKDDVARKITAKGL